MRRSSPVLGPRSVAWVDSSSLERGRSRRGDTARESRAGRSHVCQEGPGVLPRVGLPQRAGPWAEAAVVLRSTTWLLSWRWPGLLSDWAPSCFSTLMPSPLAAAPQPLFSTPTSQTGPCAHVLLRSRVPVPTCACAHLYLCPRVPVLTCACAVLDTDGEWFPASVPH